MECIGQSILILVKSITTTAFCDEFYKYWNKSYTAMSCTTRYFCIQNSHECVGQKYPVKSL